MSEWQPKETMPKEGRFLAALRVYSASTGKFLDWDIHVLVVDEFGDLEEEFGWDLEDYEIWCPIPHTPVP